MIKTYSMAARDGTLTTVPSCCKAFFKLDETSGLSLTESISGNIYTPDQIDVDEPNASTGELTFGNDYSIIIGDGSIASADFPQTTAINFGTSPIVGMFSGRATAESAGSIHCTIGSNAQSGSIGISTATKLHFAISGADASIGLANMTWPGAVAPSLTLGSQYFFVMTYDAGDLVSANACTLTVYDADGTAVYSDVSNIPTDPGVVTITPYARMHSMAFHGAAWFSVTTIPSDVQEAAQWMAYQWIRGHKVIYPPCGLWS